MVCGNPPGEPLDVMGEIKDQKGKPIVNALIDVWQAGEEFQAQSRRQWLHAELQLCP